LLLDEIYIHSSVCLAHMSTHSLISLESLGAMLAFYLKSVCLDSLFYFGPLGML
jgi:hypothetical protein